MTEPIRYDTILEAKLGAEEAMEIVLRHYDRYIRSLSKRAVIDGRGVSRFVVDEEIVQLVRQTLMIKIVFAYDPTRLPEGERIE